LLKKKKRRKTKKEDLITFKNIEQNYIEDLIYINIGLWYGYCVLLNLLLSVYCFEGHC